MNPTDKHNLIVVQPFPINKTICAGLIKYLEKIFNVYFIELPGFGDEKSYYLDGGIQQYVADVRDRIEKLNLKSYVLGGISFGYFVVNKINVDERCKAYIASEPFLGSDFLTISSLKVLFMNLLINTVRRLHAENIIWNSRFFRIYMNRRFKNFSENILANTNSKAFFNILSILTSRGTSSVLPKKSHILIINPEDRSIDCNKTFLEFKSQLGNNFLLLETHAPHFPMDPSFDYFNNIFQDQEKPLLDYLKQIDIH
jgi:hypothetical protein